MGISTSDIAQLRNATGAGMLDCKKALDEAAGDMEKAVDILRKKGIAKASKKVLGLFWSGIKLVWEKGIEAAKGLVGWLKKKFSPKCKKSHQNSRFS